MSLNASLFVGESALLTKQLQLQTVGNNIANVDREGYHRQNVELATNIPTTTYRYQTGNGVHAERIARNFNWALEASLRTATQQEGYYSEYTRYTELMEQAVSSSGESPLADSISSLANSLQTLANNPESDSTVSRRAFLAEAGKTAASFNLQHTLLDDLRGQIVSTSNAGTLPEKVGKINLIAQEMAELNDQISTLEQGFFNRNLQQANELRDDRDRLANELSTLVEVTITEQSDFTYTVNIGGVDIVSGNTVNDSLAFTLPATGPQISWVGAGTNLISGQGEVSGLMDAYASITNHMNETDVFAQQFATILNTQHTAGFTTAGVAGTNIFDASTPGAMTVLITDPAFIAAADNATNAGDGDNARAMWQAMQNPIAALSGNTLATNADRIVDSIAIEVSQAQALRESTASTQSMYKSIIAQTAGVNLDEEMILMLEVQRAFQGAAKFISVTDEMIQTVLNMI